jgi:hypothetical protein
MVRAVICPACRGNFGRYLEVVEVSLLEIVKAFRQLTLDVWQLTISLACIATHQRVIEAVSSLESIHLL